MTLTPSGSHVFISHHHKDDAGVDGMTKLLGDSGCDIRNSSIRALRPENQERMKNGMVEDETIRRSVTPRKSLGQEPWSY